MSSFSLAVDLSPRAEDIELIAQGMRRDALAQIEGEESAPIACFAHAGNAIVGGIVGRVIKARMFVELLWVDAAQRRLGIGSSLLRRLEEVAREQGCRDVLLETLSEAAARLYVGAGYRLIADIPDYVPGFAQRVLLKSLG